MLKETLKKMLAFGLSIIVMTAVIVLGVLHSYIDKTQLLELVVALLIALVVCNSFGGFKPGNNQKHHHAYRGYEQKP